MEGLFLDFLVVAVNRHGRERRGPRRFEIGRGRGMQSVRDVVWHGATPQEIA